MPEKIKQIHLPFHIRVVYHGKINRSGYKLISITFYKLSSKVIRRWEIDLTLFNRYFEINKEK